MATATRVQLNPQQTFQFTIPGRTTETATVTSKLLQENHEQHDIFFNNDGFHNHIAHHLLTLFALGADPQELQRQYANNQSYQRPLHKSVSPKRITFDNESEILANLGKASRYPDFLAFFQAEIAKTGWEAILQKYLFSGTELAETLFVRLWSSVYHPFIQLGFGVESAQPAIIAEALAETAVHDDWIGDFLKPAEKAANAQHGQPTRAIADLIDAVQNDESLRNAARWSDSSKLRDGIIISRALERMVNYASQFHLEGTDVLKLKTAEMTNAVAYFTGGAQRDEYAPKFDFYLMHNMNMTIFFSTLLEQDWLSQANKQRLLEWKVRNDLAMYASRKAPKPRMDIVRAYKPKEPSGWEGVIDRVKRMPDDGHAAKLIRALAHGQHICAPYEERADFRVKHDDWLQLGHMAIDSVEAGDPIWVRSTGFDEAWEGVPKAQL